MKKLVSIIVALGLAVAFAAPTFAMDAPAGAPLPFKLRRIKSLGRNTGARSKTSYEELVTPRQTLVDSRDIGVPVRGSKVEILMGGYIKSPGLENRKGRPKPTLLLVSQIRATALHLFL